MPDAAKGTDDAWGPFEALFSPSAAVPAAAQPMPRSDRHAHAPRADGGPVRAVAAPTAAVPTGPVPTDPVTTVAMPTGPAPARTDASVRATAHVALEDVSTGLPSLLPDVAEPRHAVPFRATATGTSRPRSLPDTPEPERTSSLSLTATEQERARMANLEQSVQELLSIDGATGAAIVDSASGMALG